MYNNSLLSSIANRVRDQLKVQQKVGFCVCVRGSEVSEAFRLLVNCVVLACLVLLLCVTEEQGLKEEACIFCLFFMMVQSLAYLHCLDETIPKIVHLHAPRIKSWS